MLEKPNLQDEKIMSCLRGDYGLPVVGIDFLPLGNDSSAWVYKVGADDGGTYFLKVRRGTPYPPSILVPRYLRDRGIEQVVAPLPTRDQDLWRSVGGFALILYPFIEGDVGMEAGLSDSQWTEFGTVLRQIHSSTLLSELLAQVRRESFSSKWSGLVRQLQATIRAGKYDNPAEKALATFGEEKSEEISHILDREEALGRILQSDSPEYVLCHADIHTANILLENHGRLHIVDWDDPVLAPRERDLMFVVEGVVGGFAIGAKEALFFKGYGSVEIDPLALAYYRYEWVVQELGDYGERVFLMKDIGEKTRRDAIRGFRQLFQSGDVVESAYQSETYLPLELRSTWT